MLSECPFQEDAPPIRLDRWLRQPVLQIDGDTYNMRRRMLEVANTQGAHSDRRGDTIRQQVNEHFRGIYLNIFVFWTSVYLGNHFFDSIAAESSFAGRVSKVHPNITKEVSRLEGELFLSREQFSAHSGWITVRPTSVSQRTQLIRGVPETKPDPSTITPVISRGEIGAPTSGVPDSE